MDGYATMVLLLAFPGTRIVPPSDGWSHNRAGLRGCITCGVSTAVLRPDGKPDHRYHYPYQDATT